MELFSQLWQVKAVISQDMIMLLMPHTYVISRGGLKGATTAAQL